MKFSYSALTESGENVAGCIESESLRDAVSLLRARRLKVIDVSSVEEKADGVLRRFLLFMKETGTVPMRHRMLFFRQIAIFLSAGISLGEALGRACDGCRCLPLKRKAEQIASAVKSGEMPGDAFFDGGLASSAERAFLKAGERSGNLAAAFSSIADLTERRAALREKLASASVYPMVIVLMSLSVLALAFCFVLPRFRPVCEEFGIQVPAFTAFLFRFSDNFSLYMAIFFAGVCMLLSVFFLLRRLPSVRKGCAGAALYFPVTGRMVRVVNLRRCMGIAALLLSSGVQLDETLVLSAESSGNCLIGDVFRRLREGIASGRSLASLCQEEPLLQPVASSLITAGEASGCLAEAFSHAAEWYESESLSAVKKVTGLIEPLLIFCVGLIAGGTVAAVFIPVVNAVSSMTGF